MLDTFVLYSGAARGADYLWGKIAHNHGITKQYHIRPKGNEKNHPGLTRLGVEPVIADNQQLQVAREQIKDLIGLSLGASLAANLKARNYYQIVKADMVLAVAKIDGLDKVQGGTDVAVQLGIALDKPVYVLDVETEEWHHYDGVTFVQCDTPRLLRRFAAVGTRDIENYKVFDEDSGNWVYREGFVGIAKSQRLIYKMDEVFKLAESQIKIDVVAKYSVDEVLATRDTHIYIFGDNTIGKGKAGQAVIRGLGNTFGIPTKNLPSTTEDAYFNDNDFELNKAHIEVAINAILDNIHGRVVVFPESGLGTGLAKLKQKAPITWEYLCKRLLEVFGYDNNK